MKLPPPGNAVNPAETSASHLFTDRNNESGAFRLALMEFRELLDSDADVGIARHNILMFHGLGGIGKTALSTRLEAWIKHGLPPNDAWGVPPVTNVSATARIDLHGSAGQLDLSAALISLRSGVAGLRRRWPAFDLAFAAYWSAIRPGEPLPTFQGRDELASAVSETLQDVLGDLGSLAVSVGTGTGAGLAIRGVKRLISELRRRRDLRLAIDTFDGFEQFLIRCADEPSPTNSDFVLACEIAGLLSWELSRIDSGPLVVVFLDTFERLTLDVRRVSEGYVNNLIYHMPNVLFVITGRNKLDWHEETRSDLAFRGGAIWPGLLPSATGELCQNLVGSLSPQDARSVAIRGRDQLNLPISDSVIDELVTASAGLPQYLELARQVAITISWAGGNRQVSVADVTGSLGSLVQRALDDIPADEQRAIRAAALFRTFDLDLVAAAAAVDHGCAERAMQRPMIDYYVGERFPYRMHDAIRDAIRHSGPEVSGGWSERDWQLAASRAGEVAHRLHDDAKARGAGRDVLDAIGLAVNLACEQETTLGPAPLPSYADWLAQAIVYAPSVQGLRARIPATSKTAYGQGVLDFVAAKTVDTPMETRIKLLRELFGTNHPLRLAAGRHLGYTLKLWCRWNEALEVFDELTRLAPSDLHRRQRPLLLSTARRFNDALEEVGEGGWVGSVRRTVEYAHGRPERYFDEIPAVILKLQATGRQREVIEENGDLLARRAFFDGGGLNSEEIGSYLIEAESVGHVVAIRSALQAVVLKHDVERTELSAVLERLKFLDRVSLDGRIGFPYASAEICDALLTESYDRLEELHREIAQIPVLYRTRSWIPIECMLDVAGLPVSPAPTQWLEPYEVVRARWRDHFNRYLASHGAASVGA